MWIQPYSKKLKLKDDVIIKYIYGCVCVFEIIHTLVTTIFNGWMVLLIWYVVYVEPFIIWSNISNHKHVGGIRMIAYVYTRFVSVFLLFYIHYFFSVLIY